MHVWDDNIKMNHKEIGWAGMDWNHLGQNRDMWVLLYNTAMNLWVFCKIWGIVCIGDELKLEAFAAN
jgi:hypothetical protein